MLAVYIPRSLVANNKIFSEEQLLQEGRVFVVLAEPGAGKTELLKTLANFLHVSCIKASIFRHRSAVQGTGHLVIDAIDEVARIDNAATDIIIAQASTTSPAAKVIFAGRSSEWDQGRTAYVKQCFDVEPIVVHLEPFGESEQRQLFTAKFPGENYEAFVGNAQRFELEPLLGNPQFLELFGEAYIEGGRVFTSKAKIFSDAVKRLAHEANLDLGRQKARPPTDRIIICAGEIFAKLLLAGSTGVATVEQISDRDFPYINGLCRTDSESNFLIDSRLLKPSDDTNKHEPIHRIVAEYCAAGYLVRRIQDPANRLSQERVFAIIAPNGVARDELRGMLGWMAALGRESLQLAAIRLDPYAVLANGDPSQLTVAAKGALLAALDELADCDPFFRRSDVWRRFNVGHFFTIEILDYVRAILCKEGHLRALILKLLVGTEAASSLATELVALMTDQAVDDHTRRLALDAILTASAYDPVPDFDSFIREGSKCALELAARAVIERGVSIFGAFRVHALLEGLIIFYPERGERSRTGASRYFINRLAHSFKEDEIHTFLDYFSTRITCSCSPKYDYQCTCRRGISKIVGRLLDRYFELPSEGHDPLRVWTWLKSLHFQKGVNGEVSASVKYLDENHELRRSIQQLSVEAISGLDAAQMAVSGLYHSHIHAGVRMHAGDPEALSQMTFELGLVEVWTALHFGHDVYNERKGPNPARSHQRRQSKTSYPFLAAWSRQE